MTSRHAQLGDDIHVGHQAFWRSWAERFASASEPAARRITSVLRATPPDHQRAARATPAR